MPAQALTSKNGTICTVVYHHSAIVGHSIFFMGGEYGIFEDGGNQLGRQKQALFSLDLNTSFPVEVSLSPDFFHNISIPSTIIPDIIGLQDSGRNGAMLATNDTFYVYGAGNKTQYGHTLASYNTTTSSWKQVFISGGEFGMGSVEGESVSDPFSGLSFFFGGNSPGGLLRLNASNPDNVTWTNQTTRFFSNEKDSIPGLIDAELVYLPVGKAGVLLLFGGYDVDPLTSTMAKVSMANIAVYDMDSSKWYSVIATGTPDIPGPRSNFCSAVSRAPDDTSFQITIYGGWIAQQQYDDKVWVLSVPSFHWIGVLDANNTEGSHGGRAGHTCHIWDDSQMIVLGGQNDDFSSACNIVPPIRLLDTSTYTWKSEYKPNNVYSVPSVVSAVTGGNSSGHSTLQSPIGGWNDSDLADIFSRALSRPIPKNVVTPSSSGAPGQPSPTSSIKSNPTSASSKVSKGVILGGVIGGLAVIMVGIAIIVFYWRREKPSNPSAVTNKSKEETQSEWRKAELGGQPILELPAGTMAELGGQSIQELPAKILQDSYELPARRTQKKRGYRKKNQRAMPELPGSDVSEVPV